MGGSDQNNGHHWQISQYLAIFVSVKTDQQDLDGQMKMPAPMKI